MLAHSKDAVIRIGDQLYDLHGNKFKVSGIEMIRSLFFTIKDWEKSPIGVILLFQKGGSLKL